MSSSYLILGKTYSGFSITAVILFFSEETRDMQLYLLELAFRISMFIQCYLSSITIYIAFFLPC